MDGKWIIVGKPGCSGCMVAKKMFDERGVNYDYQDYTQMDRDTQGEYIQIAKSAGHIGFPIIINSSGRFVTLEEIIQKGMI